MLGLVREAGHELTPDAAEADVLVVNTCAFIDSAKQGWVDAILEMAQHKASGACRRLIVTGCLAERYREELRAEIPEIDAVLGTGDVPEIVKAIGGGNGGHVAPVTFFRRNGHDISHGSRGPTAAARSGLAASTSRLAAGTAPRTLAPGLPSY